MVCLFVLAAEIMLEMQDAQTQEGVREERLRFLANFVLASDARLGGRIANAGCVPKLPEDSHAAVREEDSEKLQLRVRSLVLGIKRLRRQARNGSMLFCAPRNTSLEWLDSCSSYPLLANLTCIPHERRNRRLVHQQFTLPDEENCPDCSNDKEYSLRISAKIVEFIVLVLKYELFFDYKSI